MYKKVIRIYHFNKKAWCIKFELQKCGKNTWYFKTTSEKIFPYYIKVIWKITYKIEHVKSNPSIRFYLCQTITHIFLFIQTSQNRSWEALVSDKTKLSKEIFEINSVVCFEECQDSQINICFYILPQINYINIFS